MHVCFSCHATSLTVRLCKPSMARCQFDVVRKQHFIYFPNTWLEYLQLPMQNRNAGKHLSQTYLFAFPCCMVNIVVYAFHATWVCPKAFVQQLKRETLFFKCVTNLIRKATKTLKPCLVRPWTVKNKSGRLFVLFV